VFYIFTIFGVSEPLVYGMQCIP